MPYKEIYIKPEKLFRDHKIGIDVYRTYKNNNYDEYNTWNFSFDPIQNNNESIEKFDIRDLPEYTQLKFKNNISVDKEIELENEHFKSILRKALKNSSIPNQSFWINKQSEIKLNIQEYYGPR